MNKACVLCLFLFACLQAYAQAPTYRQVLDGLSTPAPTAAIVLPDAFFALPSSSAAGQLQRGVVLFAAAGKAREIGNPDRAPVLAVAAKGQLVAALAGSLNSAQKSQASYTLGLIAERHEGDLTAALNRYQSALSFNSDNKPAAEALARVQKALAP